MLVLILARSQMYMCVFFIVFTGKFLVLYLINDSKELFFPPSFAALELQISFKCRSAFSDFHLSK